MLVTVSSNWDIIIKLVLAVVLGGALGIERTLAGKTAGMRTYALVSLGSALFIIVSTLVAQQYIAQGIRSFDPLRVASQIVVGIGFLGAGSIIFRDGARKLSGLTTAAGIWVSSGIGMAIGFGFFTLGLLVSILTLLIFTVFWSLEQKLTSGGIGYDENGKS
ncbi:MgtC/SapB family protein [Candidatus Nomurabacteria bacterium]|nr:MgtC/SapB family protein [Candidatus Nomurabacteria bacterium]